MIERSAGKRSADIGSAANYGENGFVERLTDDSGDRLACSRRQFARLQHHAIACRKRPVDGMRIEKLVTGIQRQLETLGEGEIPSTRIGEMVMDALQGLDSVAYIRFASVYKDFTDASDFEGFAGSIAEAARK